MNEWMNKPRRSIINAKITDPYDKSGFVTFATDPQFHSLFILYTIRQ